LGVTLGEQKFYDCIPHALGVGRHGGIGGLECEKQLVGVFRRKEEKRR